MTKPSTKDKTIGKIHELKGAAKQKIGEFTNNPDLEAKGKTEHNAGKAQERIGKVEKALGK